MTEKHCSPGSAVNFMEAMNMVDRGFDTWKDKPHNAKWYNRIDGTPIPNDLKVNIAEAICHYMAEHHAPAQAASHRNPVFLELAILLAAEPIADDVVTISLSQEAWRPIETAPHEERVLLGWYQQETWFSETGMASHGWRRNGISNMSRHGFATHWRPLPDGPALTHPERS